MAFLDVLNAGLGGKLLSLARESSIGYAAVPGEVGLLTSFVTGDQR
jgi:hypothetical protein